MNYPKNSELDALINDYLEGQLDEGEAAKLSEWIENSSEVRKRYWELASVHGLLEQSLQKASLKVATGEGAVVPMRSWNLLRWQPLTAVAAGIVIGIFSASMVWAYKAPLGMRALPETMEVLFESFEDPTTRLFARFPTEAGLWFGRITSVPQSEGVVAFRGDHVAKFGTVPGRKFTYARRILDLTEYPEVEEGKTRRVEVNASFFSSEPDVSAQYQIRLGAFSQEPEAVRPIWNHEDILFDTVLQHVGQNFVTEPGQGGWKKLRASLELPPGTRSFVISLGAGNAESDSAPTEHYLDAVRVRFHDSSIIPE